MERCVGVYVYCIKLAGIKHTYTPDGRAKLLNKTFGRGGRQIAMQPEIEQTVFST